MALTYKQIRAAARRVLLAGVWMIEKDHGRLRLLPYVSPSGCHYRVELHLEGKPSSPLFRFRLLTAIGTWRIMVARECRGMLALLRSRRTFVPAVGTLPLSWRHSVPLIPSTRGGCCI